MPERRPRGDLLSLGTGRGEDGAKVKSWDSLFPALPLLVGSTSVLGEPVAPSGQSMLVRASGDLLRVSPRSICVEGDQDGFLTRPPHYLDGRTWRKSVWI